MADSQPSTKRQKISAATSSTTEQPSTQILENITTERESESMAPLNEVRKLIERSTTTSEGRELEVGITQYVDAEARGFAGTLKQRYTDFQVHEITLDGKVLHLLDDAAPDCLVPSERGVVTLAAMTEDRQPAPAPVTPKETPKPTPAPPKDEPKHEFVIKPEDMTFLTNTFGDVIRDEIIAIHASILAHPSWKRNQHGQTVSAPIIHKHIRSQVHSDVRRIFNDTLETTMDKNSCIVITAGFGPPKAAPRDVRDGRSNPKQNNSRSGNNSELKGKVGWTEKHGGEYLHMTLTKENKDTMEVISYMATVLGRKPKDFSFAGTKDRRAVTTQRMCLWREDAERIKKVLPTLRNAAIGDFKYEKQKLSLGDLEGNLFVIVLRDCDFGTSNDMEDEARLEHANAATSAAINRLQANGFLNYFGLQRFGTHNIGTHSIGLMILKGDFEGAVNALLAYDEKIMIQSVEAAAENKVNKDDISRACAIHRWKKHRTLKTLSTELPRRFSSELAIMRHLSNWNTRQDFLGALGQIQRNLRTMYVHAYQSFVWNTVVSERWARYGSKVVKGDLVLIDTKAEKAAQLDEFDENGEIVVHPSANDTAVTHDDLYQRARALTAEEAESGEYTIYEIVLPTPGFDVVYPENDIGDFYKEFMKSEQGGGIDPDNMRRSAKDFSLSGSYRLMMGRVSSDISFETRIYHGPNVQLMDTDMDRLKAAQLARSGGIQEAAKPTTQSSNSRQRHQPYRKPSDTDKAEHLKKFGSQMASWKGLADKLAKEDKESAAAAKLARETATVDDVAPAKVKEIWYATEGQNSCGRTGGVQVFDEAESEGAVKVNDQAEKPASAAAEALVEMDVDKPEHSNKPAWEHAPSEVDSLSAMDVDTSEQTSKRPAEQISTSQPSSPVATRPSTPAISKPVAIPLDHNGVPEPSRLAVIVTFSLGTSQYATMALRELMKDGGVRAYTTEFTAGR